MRPLNAPPSGSQVLVTGATGFTGQVLCRQLVQAGCRVRALARASSDLSGLADLPIRWHRGEVYDKTTVKEAAEGAETIFHVAAAFREAKSTDRDYWNVHVKSTRLLAAEAQKTPAFRRLVLVSTVGVHGHVEDPPADETYRFAPGDPYQRTKAEAEKWLTQHARRTGIPYTIIRPCAIYGPGERRFLKFFKMAAKPVFPILGKGKCWYHLVHVEDLSRAMMRASVAEEAQGQAFIVGSSRPIQLERMARIIAGVYGHPIRIVRLPIEPFFLLGDLCERVCKPLGIEPPIYRRRVAFYSKDRYFDTGKMRRLLGYRPRYENEQGIAELAEWYRDNGWLTVRVSGGSGGTKR